MAQPDKGRISVSVRLDPDEWEEMARRGRIVGFVSDCSKKGMGRYITYLFRLSTRQLNHVMDDETREKVLELSRHFDHNVNSALFWACKLALKNLEHLPKSETE